MLIPNHPDDERLSALAASDVDAIADAALTEHVASCRQCTETVGELRIMRTSLAELPDLRPSRPLRLLPQVSEQPSTADRLGRWVRRYFAPVLTAGAALALVGLVGTAVPVLQGGASGAAPGAAEGYLDSAGSSAGGQAAPGATGDIEAASSAAAAPAASPAAEINTFQGAEEERASRATDSGLPAERSIWPMVLFTGIALMVAALLLRWVLAPRAG